MKITYLKIALINKRKICRQIIFDIIHYLVDKF